MCTIANHCFCWSNPLTYIYYQYRPFLVFNTQDKTHIKENILNIKEKRGFG